jgi:outer membrane protein assembly factor BamB
MDIPQWRGPNRDGAQYIVALDLDTHTELWTAKLSSREGEPRCTPTVNDGRLYVRDQDVLMCYNLRP